MRHLPLVLAFPLLSLLPVPGSAQSVSTACIMELNAVDDSFDETNARLKKAGSGDLAAKCSAVVHHIDVMGKAREVYRRCLPPGHDREENLAQIQGTIDDFRDILAGLKCGNELLKLSVRPALAPRAAPAGPFTPLR